VYALGFVYGRQHRCHLVTLLLQLNYLPDDPETVKEDWGIQIHLFEFKDMSVITQTAPYAL